MTDEAPPAPPAPPPPGPPTDVDPASVLPVETARAVLQHWWREPLAGVAALAIGCYDTWMFGREAGLSNQLDEILVIGGVVLIAGSKHLFGGPITPTGGNGANGGKSNGK